MIWILFRVLQKKYRQQPSTFKHTSVTDSPDIIHARFSGQITNEVRRCAYCLSAFQTTPTDFTCTSSVLQRLYKEKGVNDQHSYTITTERPEITQAKVNAANFSEVAPTHSALYFTVAVLFSCWVILRWMIIGSLMQVKYRESWHTLRAQGYKLTMQDIPFQAAKSSTGIASDVKSCCYCDLTWIYLL